MHKREVATTSRWTPSRACPPETELKQAADILNKAKNPVVLVGQGARGAGAEVIEIAEKLGAPIVKALLGKEVVPDDHPLCTGGLGLLGTTPSVAAVEERDALLIIGSVFSFYWGFPTPQEGPRGGCE